MDAEIIKVYRQQVPALRFIGKKYGNKDRVNGMFGKLWGDWFKNGWFDFLEKQIDRKLNSIYEDGDAYIGLMRDNNGVFEYWIGIFMPENTPVPDGYEFHDFPKGAFGVCWLYGRESEVYGLESMCGKKLLEQGYEDTRDSENTVWCFERYACPRFTTPDDKGKIILDIGFFVK